VQKKQKKFVSDDEIANASKVHIVDFMIANGEPIERTGSSYFKHKNHDSLVLNTNGQWYWNSESIGGHGSISLARKFYDIGFVDAVNKINGMEITKQFENEIQEEKKPFVYPKEYETNTIDNAMKYLSDERMLDPKIVLVIYFIYENQLTKRIRIKSIFDFIFIMRTYIHFMFFFHFCHSLFLS